MRACRDSTSRRCAAATRLHTSHPVGPGSMSSTGSRRDFLEHVGAAGACLLTFTLDARELRLTPAQARAASMPFRTLESHEASTVEALGETLLPGSAVAGI